MMRNLDHCLELDGGKVKHHAVVLWDNVLGNDKGMEVVAKASKYFEFVEHFVYTDRKLTVWPQPQNHAWQSAARFIERTHKSGGRHTCWLWWESDALPLKAGWLDSLLAGYRKARKPFYGHIVDGETGYMNGVGLYPVNISTYAYRALLTMSAPFDVVLGHEVTIQHFGRGNDLIEHRIKDYGGDAAIQIETVDEIKKGTHVLYHGVALREPESVANPETVQYLPFQRQTKWDCGIFNLPGNTGVFHFNCGAAKVGNDILLFTRRATHKKPNHSTGGLIYTSDLGVYKIQEDDISNPLTVGYPKPLKSVRGEQWEDPRAVVFDGKVHVSFAYWIHNQPMLIKQILTVLSPDMKTFQEVAQPVYRGTDQFPEQMSNMEKNWLWFDHDDVLHCIYHMNPMVVFVWKGKRISNVYRSEQATLPWKFGNPRGGTPPLRVGNEYITFFHSHLKYMDGDRPRRRYHMGCAAFSATTPFMMTRITTKPLLSGSEYDHRAFGGPPCIFPCGSVQMKDGSFLVTFGVNDENCGWIRIPEADLNQRMVAC